MYRTMQAIRRLETACDQLYKAKKIRGFCHLSTGQEAIATGMEAAMTRDDAIITAYRCHGFAYTRGASATAIIAELMGKEIGIIQFFSPISPERRVARQGRFHAHLCA